MPRSRILVIFLVFGIFVAWIGVQTTRVQIVRSDELSDEAVANRLSTQSVPSQRGDILDANGIRLATNQPSARVWAIRPQIEDVPALAAVLAPILGQTTTELMDLMNQPDLEWVSIARQVAPDVLETLTALNLPGIYLEPVPGRVYPSGSFAAHIIGFTNIDHIGNYGIEGFYDQTIGGQTGTLAGERDGAGNIIALSASTWNPPVDGADIVLTIDTGVQRLVENVLRETIVEYGAASGTIIVQNPSTGAILGMASWPVFDPNQYSNQTDVSVFTNPAISENYEPGSTFKAIVMAIGIDDGVVTPDTVHNDAPGYLEVPDNPPITNNDGAVFGDETMTEVLEHSSNLGAIFVAEQIGAERMYRRFQEFGIGKKTGVDLQGEEQGLLTKPWERDWNNTLFYTNAFGQGVAVTPLQLVNAYSAIVNGGKLMRPYVVSEERWPDGTIVEHEPTVSREVISEQSSATLREMLYSVAENGSGIYAQVPGYKIGAKTGTAQIPDGEGGYLEDSTTASVLGFGPVDNPQFSVLVKIDDPVESPWGMTVAGPALGKVLAELFLLYGISPTEEIQ